jgi:hypothetical protein
MSSSSIFDRYALIIAATGAVIAALTYAIADGDMAVAAGVGGGLAVGNWLLSRWTLLRVFQGDKGRGVVVGVMVMKLGLFAAVLWACLFLLALNPFGLLLGLSAFVVGIFLGSALSGGKGATGAVTEEVSDA